MIDFRYHLVSIASIFLALAVGIVLGAGPLKGTIGDTLTSEVTRLRDDANNLRAELSAAEGRALAREEIIAELRPRAVSGLLDGESVSMLVLPGAADSHVEDVRVGLLEAGASVSTVATLDQSFTSQDPPAVAERTAAAAALREEFANDLPVGASADEVIDIGLGWALASKPRADSGESSSDASTDSPTDTPPDGVGVPEGDGTGTTAGAGTATGAATGTGTQTLSDETGPGGEPSDDLTPGADDNAPRSVLRADETSRQILDILAERGLLSHASDGLLGDSVGIVVITPEADEVAPEDVTRWADLLASYSEGTAVTVVGEVSEDTALEANLIATIRDDGALSGEVSTIDNVGTPIGRVAVPFVISEEVAGTAGHYGDLDSASDDFPAVPAEER